MSNFNEFSLAILEAFGNASGLNKPMKPGLGARKLTTGLTQARPAVSATKPLNSGQIKLKPAIREDVEEFDWHSMTIAEAEDVVEAICLENADILETELLGLGLSQEDADALMWNMDLDEDFMNHKLLQHAEKKLKSGLDVSGKRAPTYMATKIDAHQNAIKRLGSQRMAVMAGKMQSHAKNVWGAKELAAGHDLDKLDKWRDNSASHGRKVASATDRMSHARGVHDKWQKRASALKAKSVL